MKQGLVAGCICPILGWHRDHSLEGARTSPVGPEAHADQEYGANLFGEGGHLEAHIRQAADKHWISAAPNETKQAEDRVPIEYTAAPLEGNRGEAK